MGHVLKSRKHKESGKSDVVDVAWLAQRPNAEGTLPLHYRIFFCLVITPPSHLLPSTTTLFTQCLTLLFLHARDALQLTSFIGTYIRTTRYTSPSLCPLCTSAQDLFRVFAGLCLCTKRA